MPLGTPITPPIPARAPGGNRTPVGPAKSTPPAGPPLNNNGNKGATGPGKGLTNNGTWRPVIGGPAAPAASKPFIGPQVPAGVGWNKDPWVSWAEGQQAAIDAQLAAQLSGYDLDAQMRAAQGGGRGGGGGGGGGGLSAAQQLEADWNRYNADQALWAAQNKQIQQNAGFADQSRGLTNRGADLSDKNVNLKYQTGVDTTNLRYLTASDLAKLGFETTTANVGFTKQHDNRLALSDATGRGAVGSQGLNDQRAEFDRRANIDMNDATKSRDISLHDATGSRDISLRDLLGNRDIGLGQGQLQRDQGQLTYDRDISSNTLSQAQQDRQRVYFDEIAKEYGIRGEQAGAQVAAAFNAGTKKLGLNNAKTAEKLAQLKASATADAQAQSQAIMYTILQHGGTPAKATTSRYK